MILEILEAASHVRNGVKILGGEELSMVSKKNYIDRLQNTDMDDVKASLSGAADTVSETAGGFFESIGDFFSGW